MTTQIAEYTGSRAIIINSYDEAYNLCKMVTKTEFSPKSYRGKPEDATIAMLFGMEAGLPPFASLQNVAVINGQPTLWGDAMLALVENSGLLEDYSSSYIGTPFEDDYRAVVTIKRKGRKSPLVSEFSVADAKRAGLWDKKDNWRNYSKRMLLNRAKSFALREGFPDILKGFRSREEMEDSVSNAKNVTNETGIIDDFTNNNSEVSNGIVYEVDNTISKDTDKTEIVENYEVSMETDFFKE